MPSFESITLLLSSHFHSAITPRHVSTFQTGAGEGNAEQPISCGGFGSHPCYGTTWRATPSLRSIRLKTKRPAANLAPNPGPYIYPHTDRVRCSARSFKHYRSIPDSIGGRVPSVRNEEIALFSQRMTFWRETGVRNVARRDTVRLQPNPGQRNGKNLCRPHPETRQSLDPFILRFQERLNVDP